MKRLAKLSEINPNPNNPRVIKDDKFKKLVESLKTFPKMLEKRPIVVDENMVILGGNMRFRAAKEAGYKEVWIDVAEDWTDEEKREFIIKDNASGGEWDWDILANEWDANLLNKWDLNAPVKLDENNEWADIDDFEANEKSLKLVIQFETEEDRNNFEKEYGLKIRTKGKNTWSTWYPYKDRNDFSNVKLQ